MDLQTSVTDKVKLLTFTHDNELREALIFELVGQGFEVEEAGDLETALTLLTTQRFTAVFTSAMEPMFEGLDLFNKMKGSGISIPIVLVLGATVKIKKEDILAGSVGETISFPFTKEEMRRAVEKILGQDSSSRTRVERKVADLNINFEVAEVKKTVTGKINDISMGGAKILTLDDCPKVGNRILFKIIGNGSSESLEGTALVRWTRIEGGLTDRYIFGIKFLHIDDSNIYILERLLSGS